MSIERLRVDIPFLQRAIYLDSAAVCPPPQPVLDAMARYYEECPANYKVGIGGVSRKVTQLVEAARAACATLLNCRSSEEVIFTKNCTEAINLVASGLAWKSGDEVVVTAIEHQSNVIPWLRLCNTAGVTTRIVPASRDGFLKLNDMAAAISPRTRLVTVTHMSNVFGTIQPVSEIVRLARKFRALTLVDMAQSAGRVPIDLQAIGCDFATFSGRKSLLGPQGTGILYGRREALEILVPVIVGSVSAKVTGPDSFEYASLPYRLEAGILNTAGVIGLGEAARYLSAIGIQAIQKRIRQLTEILRQGLLEIPDVEVYGSNDLKHQGGIVAWNILGRGADAVAHSLYDRARVIALSGDLGAGLVMRSLGVSGVVRTSVYAFNTENELLTCLEQVRELARLSRPTSRRSMQRAASPQPATGRSKSPH